MESSAKCPWVEMVLANDGVLHMVKCRVSTEIGKKQYLIFLKLHTLQTHEKRSRHKKNTLVYFAKHPTIVLERINSNITVESKRKLATLFQVLSDGRPMAKFSSRVALCELIGVLDLPKMHSTDGAGLIMALHMLSIVQDRIKAIIGATQYISMSSDETSDFNNCSYIAAQCYVMHYWTHVPMLISLQKFEADEASADNLTSVIVSAVRVKTGLSVEVVVNKLMCFGADGVAAF